MPTSRLQNGIRRVTAATTASSHCPRVRRASTARRRPATRRATSPTKYASAIVTIAAPRWTSQTGANEDIQTSMGAILPSCTAASMGGDRRAPRQVEHHAVPVSPRIGRGAKRSLPLYQPQLFEVKRYSAQTLVGHRSSCVPSRSFAGRAEEPGPHGRGGRARRPHADLYVGRAFRPGAHCRL